MSSPEAIVARLENLEHGPGEFRHADHVEAAWCYLTLFGLPEAIARYSRALRAFAAAAGHPEKYHETITWAYMLLVNERMGAGGEETWSAFRERNPDLFVWPGGALARYYTSERLSSDAARRRFLLPDRLAGAM